MATIEHESLSVNPNRSRARVGRSIGIVVSESLRAAQLAYEIREQGELIDDLLEVAIDSPLGTPVARAELCFYDDGETADIEVFEPAKDSTIDTDAQITGYGALVKHLASNGTVVSIESHSNDELWLNRVPIRAAIPQDWARKSIYEKSSGTLLSVIFEKVYPSL